MRTLRLFNLAATLVAAAGVIGCGGGDKKGGTTQGGTTQADKGDTGTVKPAAKGKLEPIEAKETAVLKGRVTFDGTPPTPASLMAQVQTSDDKAHCLKDESGDSTTDRTWVVSKDGGVANVAVWVLPGDGKYFKLPEKGDWAGEAATDQPFCAFEPHVQIHFPAATGADKKASQKSGQVFKIKNSADIAHNTNYQGDPLQGISGNLNLAPKSDRVIDLPPSTTEVVRVVCDRHKWMRGYVWSLPTPYAAVTDKDGNFEIKGIPAGVAVKVVVWHEGPAFFGPNGAKGEVVTLKPGDNSKDMKVKPK